MTYVNGGYSDHLSVSAIVRMHNEAVLSKLGNERVEHLKRAQFACKDALARYGQDPKMDREEFETLTKLDAQIQKDMAEAQQHAGEMMPDDDTTRMEP